MRERFLAEYLKTYGYRDETAIELVKIRLIGRGLRARRLDFAAMTRDRAPGGERRDEPRGLLRSRSETSPRRRSSRVGRSIASRWPGPLIIDEFDATIVVPPDATVWRDATRQHRHGDWRRLVKVDPITFAVIKSGLDSIVDDMAYTVVRIARSEIVKDVMDFSAALCDADGQMVAQAKTIALHLGAVPEAIAAVLAEFGDDLNEGDAVIMNDPYHGGMHLPDIFMFVPIFHGGKRRAFSVVICHHTDVGGRVPGSNASDSTEIYQEGIRIPPLKLYARGRLDATLEKLIKINVRVPERVWGDLQAQYAASQVGAQGSRPAVRALRRRRGRAIYGGADGLRRTHDARGDPPLAEGDLSRSSITSIRTASPTIRFRSRSPSRSRRTAWSVDYAGSSPQVKAALNSTKSYTHSNTYLSVRCVLSRDIPNNVGVFRCIKVKVPDASVLNPVLPGACAARALTGYRIFDTMLGALAQIVPDRVPAAGEGGNSVVCISGLRRNRKPFIIVDMLCGAWGGRPDKDGVEAITNPSQNLSNMPVEVMEAEHPVRVEEYAFVPDSCGAGRWRGGVGIKRSYRILADEALLQLRTDRVKFRTLRSRRAASRAASRAISSP